MPEYLAPGVYVEEVSYRTKSIEGVGTTTTAFVGPTRYGPLYDPPELLTSLHDFELAYGDGEQLDYADLGEVDNYMWHAVRAFFVEGGSMLYAKRIFRATGETDGIARGTVPAAGGGGEISVAARHPGAAGNFHVRFTLSAGQNVLAVQKTAAGTGTGSPPTANTPVVRGLNDRDVVLVTQAAGGSPPPEPVAAIASATLDTDTGAYTWAFDPAGGGGSPPQPIPLSALDPTQGDQIQVVTVTVSVSANTPDAPASVWSGLPLDQQHRLAGAPDALSAVFDATSHEARGMPIVVSVGTDDGTDVFARLLGPGGVAALVTPGSTVDSRSVDVVLDGGNDGDAPQDAEYEGTVLPDDSKTGLVALEDIDEVSIVAAPGSTARYAVSDADAQMAHAIVNGLIAHAELMRYRIAVIDSGVGMTINDVRQMRAQFDSSWSAFYYPWVQILDPITGVANLMPPSGFIAGVYARNDVNRGVYKAPANEVINLAINFERPINKAQQEVLNPEGINCLRFFEDRGYRIWGARTMSSDPEWKYVNLRRYFAFLEHSLDKGTQWAVFEPNGEALWANVRGTIDDFLFDQWQSGALLGDKAEQAYFVRCDRSTMTQNDLDNGRLVCEIGVAALRPAEFVIFRIGQWTGDATS
jgi:phage tail sheath protein FI